MCFSAPASFTAGTALISVSAYTIRGALARNRYYLLFALIPLFFGIQQFIEGFVWLGFGWNNEPVIKIGTLAFLFFAFTFWPIYSPLAVYFAEIKENKEIKRILFFLIFVGIVVGTATFLPVIFDFVRLTTKVVNHSISYHTNRPQWLKDLFVWLYLLATIPPFLIVSDIRMKVFGYLLLISVIISDLFYRYAFDSVWCFFAALLSIYVIYVIYRMPRAKKI